MDTATKRLRQEVYIESGEIGSREFVSQLTAIKVAGEKMQSENFVTTFGEQSSTHGAQHGVLCVLECYGHRYRV